MIHRALLSFIATLALGTTLTGCTSSSHYAPLLPRAEENEDAPRHPLGLQPWKIQPGTAESAAFIRDAHALADSGDVAFQNALVSTRSAIASGRTQPQASEAWIKMEEALAGLNEARSPTQRAISMLEAQILAAYDGDGVGINEFEEARADIAQQVATQDQTLAELDQFAHGDGASRR